MITLQEALAILREKEDKLEYGEETIHKSHRRADIVRYRLEDLEKKEKIVIRLTIMVFGDKE
jgi:hypothetical protein